MVQLLLSGGPGWVVAGESILSRSGSGICEYVTSALAIEEMFSSEAMSWYQGNYLGTYLLHYITFYVTPPTPLPPACYLGAKVLRPMEMFEFVHVRAVIKVVSINI